MIIRHSCISAYNPSPDNVTYAFTPHSPSSNWVCFMRPIVVWLFDILNIFHINRENDTSKKTPLCSVKCK